MKPLVSLFVLFLVLVASGTGAAAATPTEDEARAFLERAERELLDAWVEASRAAWVQATYITHDTEILAAKANEKATALSVSLANEAKRFQEIDLPEELERKLGLVELALVVPAPSAPAKTRELSQILARMESVYGRGKYCPERLGGECLDLTAMERILAEERDPAILLDVWQGWRQVSPALRDDYVRYVELGNEGARELGFSDLGAMWRSKYDMPPDDFARELDRLWNQVRPLYLSLHAYVRSRLVETYGKDVVPPEGAIPAHLLGNMWAQQWANIYPLVAPTDAPSGFDLTRALKKKGIEVPEMFRIGERFFLSLGFEPLPETFWERSLFTKPADRDVVCHASAWNVDVEEDLRIKMCTEVDAEDFVTIHHELGHNFYQRAYRHLSPLYRDSANDGFHEALGDTLALSMTPRYLKELGLVDEEPSASEDIPFLLRMALDKVAFLPFGLLVDQWRWKTFSGEAPENRYNQTWWELREKYQGVAAPVARSETDFDPGAKYHVPASVPYSRYFLAHILQFQFHRALCRVAGHEGPLNRCTIYGNEEAGRRLQAMMEMGASHPWPDALEALTGEREMDATAILEYFAPLQAWLDEQNRGKPVGW